MFLGNDTDYNAGLNDSAQSWYPNHGEQIGSLKLDLDSLSSQPIATWNDSDEFIWIPSAEQEVPQAPLISGENWVWRPWLDPQLYLPSGNVDWHSTL